MRGAYLKFLVAGVLLATVTVTVPVRSQPLPRPIQDTEELCSLTSFAPAAAYVPVVDSGDEISVDLFVLADRGISEYRTSELVAKAQKAYTPLKMKLNIVGFQEVVFQGTDTRELFAQAKALFGGQRPPEADAVMIFTSVDITNSTGNGVIGQADCVGGIEFPTKSFVVIEDWQDDEPLEFEPVTFWGNIPAKVVAHELAHLFGAHHQYSNCVEGVPSEAEDSEASPCTLMFPDVSFVSLAFSALEGTVTRGYALEHLSP